MLIQPTLDSLNRLKLYGMAAALSEQLWQLPQTPCRHRQGGSRGDRRFRDLTSRCA